MYKTFSKIFLILFITILFQFSKTYGTIKAVYSNQFAQIIAADSAYNKFTLDIFNAAKLDSAGLELVVFQKAITGFYNLQSDGLVSMSNLITIIDFDKGSCSKRLYLIDLNQKKLLLNTWVAHGKNSGGDKPDHFSNLINSNESSVGFYLTGEIYFGSHGKSMRLDGLDQGFNNNARERAIVLHGADYVCQGAIDEMGRLGKSFGCPAVPLDLSDKIIDATANRSVIFMNHSDDDYYSEYLDVKNASRVALQKSNFLASS